jgi:hypothetical protein
VLPYISPEVLICLVEAHKFIFQLFVANVPVVAFAGFVVEPDHALSIGDVGQSVLEAVRAARNRSRQLPYHQFSKSTLAQYSPFP